MGTGNDAASYDEGVFHAVADRTLAELFEIIEDTLGGELDVDLEGGILSIQLASGGQYVINKHAPNRQIWLSSPASGACHFAYAPGRGWTSTRSDAVLHELLAAELSAATGKPISFEAEA